MKALRIVQWDERYEVSVKGRPWRPGEPKRTGPLGFVRSKANGSRKTQKWLLFLEVAGKTWAAPAFGVFEKLLEIAAEHPPELRGWVLSQRNGATAPASAEDIGWMTGFSTRHIAKAVEILTSPKVRWVEWAEFPGTSRNVPECPGTSRTSPGDSGALLENKTDNKTKHTQKKKKSVCVPSSPTRKRGFDADGNPL